MTVYLQNNDANIRPVDIKTLSATGVRELERQEQLTQQAYGVTTAKLDHTGGSAP